MSLQESQLAWMAGFADGEGCIHISKCVSKRKSGSTNTTYQLIFHVSQKERASVARFAEFFGGGSLGVEYRKGNPYWYWRATGPFASETLKQLLPFMFTKKREAENAIAFQEFKKANVFTRGKKGSGYSSATKEAMGMFHTKSKSLNQSIEQIQ